MTKNRYMTPADIKREYTAIEFIDLVVDERMTIKEAAVFDKLKGDHLAGI